MNDVALIILYDDNKKILMQHRSSDAPTSPDHWGFFGGNIEKNETPYKSIIRETYEELEIKLKKPKLFHKEYVNIKNKEHTNFYFIEKIEDKNKIQLHEGQGLGWFSPNEVQNLLAKQYVKNVMKIINEKLKTL